MLPSGVDAPTRQLSARPGSAFIMIYDILCRCASTRMLARHTQPDRARPIAAFNYSPSSIAFQLIIDAAPFSFLAVIKKKTLFSNPSRQRESVMTPSYNMKTSSHSSRHSLASGRPPFAHCASVTESINSTFFIDNYSIWLSGRDSTSQIDCLLQQGFNAVQLCIHLIRQPKILANSPPSLCICVE